jgi:signal transduction histidine kinase
MDDFLACALHELKTAIGRINTNAELLESQFACDPGTDVLRGMVRDLRSEAELVTGLIDDVLA